MNTASLPKFRLRLLGRFELSGPDGPVDLPNKKLAGLLAYLACTAPIPQNREKLATLLWGSHFEAQARQNLRQALFRLRRALGENVLLGDGEQVSLAPGTLDCDATKLEALIRERSRATLAAAVDLYAGLLLSDITVKEEAWTDWLNGEQLRLESLALDAMVNLGELELQAGLPDRALAIANKSISINGLREDAHRLLIRAFAAAGRRADALNHYQLFVELLKRELNVEPDATTKQLIKELRGMASLQAPLPQDSGVPTTPAVDAATRPTPMGALALPDKPSIAVLPFDNLSGDPGRYR